MATRLLRRCASLATNVGLFAKLSYDPRKDLQAVTQLIVAPALVVVPNQSPYKSFADLVQGARADSRA
jgi:tripartite-type tricarboxylate transporter receptor subunit TctC